MSDSTYQSQTTSINWTTSSLNRDHILSDNDKSTEHVVSILQFHQSQNSPSFSFQSAGEWNQRLILTKLAATMEALAELERVQTQLLQRISELEHRYLPQCQNHSTPSPSPSTDSPPVEDADTVARLSAILRANAVDDFSFKRVPPDYYDWPLEARRDALGAHSIDHLCKSIVLVYIYIYIYYTLKIKSFFLIINRWINFVYDFVIVFFRLTRKPRLMSLIVVIAKTPSTMLLLFRWPAFVFVFVFFFLIIIIKYLGTNSFLVGILAVLIMGCEFALFCSTLLVSMLRLSRIFCIPSTMEL